ncbi:hypothetical protein SAMN05443661_1638 [Natronobacterium gregoryi]|nr:hypothetical protein Natgr_2723 [Natronobacterium gregoryi SP2]SFJ71205.1 hypothetical protein SAMN05443661_1638 [Natronobacterium gregoryi]
MNNSRLSIALGGIGLLLVGIAMYLQQNLIAAGFCMVLAVFTALQLVSKSVDEWLNEVSENILIVISILALASAIVILEYS